MGNRAVISLKATENSPAIYLHWNGGLESVLAFLDAAKALGIRSPEADPSYFLARLTQLIGNFFGGTTSVGIGTVGSLDCDNGDNGHYIVGGNFKVLERRHSRDTRTTVEALGEGERLLYASIRAKLVRCQGPAFDDTEYRKEVRCIRAERP